MKQWLKRIAFVLAVLVLYGSGLLAYAYFIEPQRLVVHSEDLSLRNFAPALNGFKIVAISDIHGGSCGVTDDKLRKIVGITNAQNPDLVVLLGDFVSEKKFDRAALRPADGTTRTDLKMPVDEIAHGLEGLKAKYGVFGVIGNHDWWHNDTRVHDGLAKAGIKFLENEIVEIPVGNETLKLWGIEDFWKHRAVPTVPFDALSDKQNVIAITHNPDSLLKAPPGFALMLAGHSHGGQVSFPFIGAPFAFVNDRRFMKGLAEVDGKRVFVTTGIGCTGPQLRFGVPPEIAVLTLRAE